MAVVTTALRHGFERVEGGLDRVFGPEWNPLYQLGALGFLYYWIVAVSGIYLYVFFDTGTTEAYRSVEYMTYDQWYLAGVMRSLHRYASDGMVLMMAVHALREFALGRLRGPRWFTWVTGMPIAWLVVISGISGYWLVWDRLAQYVAVATTEWLDWLPIFGEPIARNFLSEATLDDRFFSLLVFIHIAVPLILLFVLWVHLQRVSRPQYNPRRGLAVGSVLMLLALSLVKPALSQGPANLATVPAEVGLDWFYLAVYPLMGVFSHGAVWGFVVAISLAVAGLPWLPPRARPAVAQVDLANCNGCTRCEEDCPYNAVTMQPRSDGQPFEREAVVDPSLCVSCGICAGACPTAMPFRRRSELVAGIDLPERNVAALRRQVESACAGLADGPRILVFGCDHGIRPSDAGGPPSVAFVSLACIGALPPAFIDYALSRDLAEGVLLTGCGPGDCFHRFGIDWTEQRLAGTRDPRLRARVPRERLRLCWAKPHQAGALSRSLRDFATALSALPAPEPPPGPPKRDYREGLTLASEGASDGD